MLVCFFPQALDEEYLKVDAQFGGVDQRKIFTFAEKVTVLFLVFFLLRRRSIHWSFFLCFSLFCFMFLSGSGLSCSLWDLCCSVQAPEHVGSLVMARGLSGCISQAYLPCSLWDLGSPIRDQTHTCRIGGQILNHWNTREVRIRVSWMCQSQQSYGTVDIILLVLQIRKLDLENKKALRYHTVSDWAGTSIQICLTKNLYSCCHQEAALRPGGFSSSFIPTHRPLLFFLLLA